MYLKADITRRLRILNKTKKKCAWCTLLNHKMERLQMIFIKNMLFTLSLGGGKECQQEKRCHSQEEWCEQTGAEHRATSPLCRGLAHRARAAAGK